MRQESGLDALRAMMARKQAAPTLAIVSDEQAKATLTRIADAASTPSIPSKVPTPQVPALPGVTPLGVPSKPKLRRGPKRAQRSVDPLATTSVPTYSRMIDAWVLPPNERRAATNLAPHVELPRQLAGYTVGQATKARRTSMKACPCRLCALALNPPKTFAEAAALGFDLIAAEHHVAEAWRCLAIARAAKNEHLTKEALKTLKNLGEKTP